MSIGISFGNKFVLVAALWDVEILQGIKNYPVVSTHYVQKTKTEKL